MNDTRSTFRQFAITERRPAEQYKTLREGDVLRCEDEHLMFGKWHRTSLVGRELTSSERGLFRRPQTQAELDAAGEGNQIR